MMADIPALERYIATFGDSVNTRITYYRTYLMQTDYVAAKIAECAYLGQPVEDKYNAILTRREEARQAINQLQNETEE